MRDVLSVISVIIFIVAMIYVIRVGIRINRMAVEKEIKYKIKQWEKKKDEERKTL